MGITLTDDVIRSLKPARILKESSPSPSGAPGIGSVDCSGDGSLLLASCPADCRLRLYSMHRGTLQMDMPLLSSSSSAAAAAAAAAQSSVARFTHSPHSALVAVSCPPSASAASVDECAVRHVSLHDGRTLRVHRGHTGPVVCIALHPHDDGFLSCSTDGTVRLWDLRDRSPVCRGRLTVASSAPSGSATASSTATSSSPLWRPTAAVDPSGMVFAVGSGGLDGVVRLFDMRQHDRGPFATWIVPQDAPAAVLGMHFSPDGKELLCTTDAPSAIVLDAYSDTGTTLHEHPIEQPLPPPPPSSSSSSPLPPQQTAAADDHQSFSGGACASYTPDGRYMLVPEGSGLRVLSRSSGWRDTVLSRDGLHAHPLTALLWNPVMCVMVSACSNIALWLPSL